jgi:hypothetical protein
MPQLLKAARRVRRIRAAQAREEQGKHPQPEEFPSRRHIPYFIESGGGVTLEQWEL